MATKANTASPKKNVVPERATIRINELPSQKVQDDVVITVKGVRYQIQRGVDVSVPIAVARAFELWQRECEDAKRIEYELMFEG